MPAPKPRPTPPPSPPPEPLESSPEAMPRARERREKSPEDGDGNAISGISGSEIFADFALETILCARVPAPIFPAERRDA